MILAVTYLAVVMPEIVEVEIFWIAGVSTVVFAFATGWMFGAWYQPVNGKKPTFELFFCPLLVLVLSLMASMFVCWGWALMLGLGEASPWLGLIALFGFAAGNFLVHAWPALLVCFGLVALWLAGAARGLPDGDGGEFCTNHRKQGSAYRPK